MQSYEKIKVGSKWRRGPCCRCDGTNGRMAGLRLWVNFIFTGSVWWRARVFKRRIASHFYGKQKKLDVPPKKTSSMDYLQLPSLPPLFQAQEGVREYWLGRSKRLVLPVERGERISRSSPIPLSGTRSYCFNFHRISHLHIPATINGFFWQIKLYFQ